MNKIRQAIANPYEAIFMLANGERETVEVYAYTAQDACTEAIYIICSRREDTEGMKIASLQPPRRCWATDPSEVFAINRLLADLGREDGA